MQKEKRLLWISHCGLQLGSDEFLAFGARIVAGSYDFAAWISECGQMCTVCVRFIRITGHLGFLWQIFKPIRNGSHFCTLKWQYDRMHDRYIYIYIERKREGIGNPPTCVGGSLPLVAALGPPVTLSGTAD